MDRMNRLMKKVVVPPLFSSRRRRSNVVIIMESCLNMKQLKQIQAHMTRTGLISHTFLLSRLLAFSALSDFHHSLLLWTHLIPNPNTFMWNTIIRASILSNFPTSAFSFFRNMMIITHTAIDSRTFVLTLKACRNFNGLLHGQSLHCLLFKMGFYSQLLVRNGLIHFYSALRVSLSSARKVFDESCDRDVVTWTTMIDGYAALQCSDKALELFNLMLLAGGGGVEPNDVTLIAVLSACSHKGYLEMGKRIHQNIENNKPMSSCSLSLHNALLDMYVKCGCLICARELFDRMGTRDVYSWTSLVNGYAKCGDLESARSFFDQTPQKNSVSWSAMIAGYSQNNKPKESLKLFHEMISADIAPVEHTLVSVLSACGQLSCLSLGHWIHEYYVHGKKMHLTVTLGNAVIDMYAKCGSISAAAQVFSSMSERNLVSWNSMIAGYAANGQAKQAISLFDQMRNIGFKPDDITFVSLLTACSHGGLISQGQGYFDSMEMHYGIKPKREHYACMIDLLGRNGLLEEAYVFITKMPMQPSEAAWGALLNACRMHGNVELAKLSAWNLLSLDPDDSGIYVLLANICANERKWADVKKVRSLMREKGVKKNPGHSLIEIEGEFIEFLAADVSHPQSEDIYKVLDEMYLLSKLEDVDWKV